jgi:hypothetical protein
MKYLIIILALLSSCTAEWHLKQAIKKNPKYGDSTYKTVIFKKDTLIKIYDTIPGDSSFQSTVFYRDSLNKVFSDSFTTVYQTVDSLNKVKTTVVRRPIFIHDSILVSVRDTVKVEVPKTIELKEGYPIWYFWVLITIFVLVLWLILKK